MKKILLAVVCLATISLNAIAQLNFAGVVGLNLANLSSKSGGSAVSTDMNAGFHFGVVGQMCFGEKICFMPGLIYSMKGATQKGNGMTDKININYLEIPLNIRYCFHGCNESGLFVFAGPYLGYALSGKQTLDVTGSGSASESLKFGSDSNQVKRMDFGVNIGVGYNLNSKMFISAQYGLGLSNIDGKGDADNFDKNRVIGVSFGYFLRKD
jgi:hypothetical protein